MKKAIYTVLCFMTMGAVAQSAIASDVIPREEIASELRYPARNEQWTLKKYNRIYSQETIIPVIAVLPFGVSVDRSVTFPAGYRSRSLDFKSQVLESYVQKINISQESNDLLRATIHFRHTVGSQALYPHLNDLRKEMTPCIKDDITDKMLQQIKAVPGKQSEFLKICYAHKFIPDFMVGEILSLFEIPDFRPEGSPPIVITTQVLTLFPIHNPF